MSNWISVDNEMPYNKLVILFWSHNDSAIRIGAFYSSSNRFVSDGDMYDRHDITHWQSLPEPPKEAE